MTDAPNMSDPMESSRLDKIAWSIQARPLLVAFVMLGIVCSGATFFLWDALRVNNPPAPDSMVKNMLANTTGTLTRSNVRQDTFYFVSAPNGKGNDLYTLTVTGTVSQTTKLTDTSDFSELFPVPSPIDDRVAFFAVSVNNDRSLRVIDKQRRIIDLTYNVADSGLGQDYDIDLTVMPQWSDDAQWIAFLARGKGDRQNSIEMFVAQVNSSTVYRLTQGGSAIIAFRWSGADEIIYSNKGNDASLALYRISLNGLPHPTPMRLTVIESKP